LLKEERTLLIVVSLGSFFHIQSVGSINVSLAAIQKEFATSLAAIQWIGLMGAIMLTSLSLCFGRAGDLIGRKRLFAVGLTLYSLGAGAAAFAGSFPMLLGSRCVMALGLAMAAPLAAAIVASAYPHENRGQALGWLSASIALGRTTGPTIGGLLLHLWGWRAVFLGNFLFGVPTCFTLFWILGVSEERRQGSFDFLGVLFLVLGFPSLLIALSLGPRAGWNSSMVLIWFALATSALASFVWRERHTPSPLMNLSYLRRPALATALSSLVLATLASYPVSIFGPLYMRNVVHVSPLVVGLAMAILPLCTTLASPLSGRLADRWRPGWVVMLGLGFILFGVWLYGQLDAGSSMTSFIVALCVLGTGIGFFIPANEKVSFATAGTRDYGMVSAMLTAFQTGAGALGTAIAVALAEASKKATMMDESQAFAEAQQFAFSWLLPLAALAIVIALVGRRRG
jgi:EmrB/QacA subfamily drug resistance transporter